MVKGRLSIGEEQLRLKSQSVFQKALSSELKRKLQMHKLSGFSFNPKSRKSITESQRSGAAFSSSGGMLFSESLNFSENGGGGGRGLAKIYEGEEADERRDLSISK